MDSAYIEKSPDRIVERKKERFWAVIRAKHITQSMFFLSHMLICFVYSLSYVVWIKQGQGGVWKRV